MENQRFREHISATTGAPQIVLTEGQWYQIPSGHWAQVIQVEHLDGMGLQVYGLDLAHPSADDWRRVGTIHALSDGLLEAEDFTDVVWTRVDLRLATPEEAVQLDQRTFGPTVWPVK